MLRQRALSALVFVPLVLTLAYLGGLIFELFWAAVLAFAGFEFVRMARRAGFQLSYPLTILFILLIAFSRIKFEYQSDWIVFIGFLLAVSLVGLFQYEHGDEKAFSNLILHLFCFVYVGFSGAFAFSMNRGETGENWLLLLTIGLVWLVDAGAYLIGTRFGKRGILPRLSPKKTLEGFLGGTLVGILFGALLGWLLSARMSGLTPWSGALFGGIMGPAAFFGDAVMSLIKRTLGVKDTGRLLPGHGGVLDRLDSMLWALAVGELFRQAILLGIFK